jgi:sRNA-binding regulator protein Hfq
MNAQTLMVVVLNDGERLEGIIEWYDRTCIKLNREGAPNLLLMKHVIRYMHKKDCNGTDLD